MAQLLPEDVLAAITQAIGAPFRLSVLAGGTNNRTFLAESDGRRFVVRSEPAPALSLQRAVAAQARAHTAGVRTPITIAHDQTDTEEGAYFWSIETYTPGKAFEHDITDLGAAAASIRDLARQLRLLHTIEVDAFGDLPPRPYPVYPSQPAWVANKARRIEAAVALAGAEPGKTTLIEQVYTLLASIYTGTPRLCKGDCAGANLLVDTEQNVTIIDWEWAQGLDPASDLAYWCRFTPNQAAQALLLEAYEPEQPALLYKRVQAYQIINAIETIHVFDEHSHAFDAGEREAGIRAEWEVLLRLLL